MENYFKKFRLGIIGNNQTISTPIHKSINLLYADWTASGRTYLPIEERIREKILPYVANTHTDINYTGSKMTYAYHKAQELIKAHVGASKNDIIICSNSGMTGVINKFQRILGLRVHESFKNKINLNEEEKPVVFITHMEHHSNQTTWLETIADVVIVPPDNDGLVSIENFREHIEKYNHRKTKIAAITSCSNVTGIMTPYMDIAALIHKFNGLCFVDFACSAPYVSINMHDNDSSGRFLDAIYLSPHKFLGGPGSSGVLVFNQKLYSNTIPDNPGGGTVNWTNPWGDHSYIEDIEAREDGGTPSFLQTIKVAMCMQLKDEMGVNNILKREKEILEKLWTSLEKIPNLYILASKHKKRLGVISFFIEKLHYDVGVKMLNDRFGIQTRGGCSCAGTYGHYLLNLDEAYSKNFTDLINQGDCSARPGWIRLSIHPTHTDNEIDYIVNSIKELADNYHIWKKDYDICHEIGSIKHLNNSSVLALENDINQCFAAPFAD